MSLEHRMNVRTKTANTGSSYTVRNQGYSQSNAYNAAQERLNQLQETRYQEIVERNREAERSLERVRGELHDQALHNEKKLQELSNNYYNQLNQQKENYNQRLNEMQNEIRGEIKNQGEQIIELRQLQKAQKEEYDRLHNEALNKTEEEKRQRIESFDKLQDQIDNIHATENKRIAMAQEAREAVQILSEEIGKMPHAKFAPGRLENIKRRIDSVGRASIPMPQAEWWQYTQTWQELWDLKTDIQLNETQYLMKHEQALRTAILLIAEAEENKERVLEFNKAGSEEKQTLNVDIDFWSKGEWSAHTKRLGEHKQILEESFALDSFGLEEVEHILNELSDEGSRLRQIIIDAGNNVFASELRFDLAEIGANVLLGQLYKEDSVQATYEGEDQRAGYVLQMENENGVKVTMVVSDAENVDEPGAFKLTLNFENDQAGLSQEEARKRSEEIEQRILKDAMLSLEAQKEGESVCGFEADRSFSDINEVKNRKEQELKTMLRK